MAVINPFYNEETGHVPLDEMEPWQLAMLNPGSRNPGMSMPGYDQNLINQINGQGSVANPGAGTGGGMMPSDPYTWTGNSGSSPGNTNFNNVFNSGTTPRPSQATPTIASPALLANNMGMTGAQNVGGVGMYTGSNGPLDLNRFTPVNNQQQNGPPPGSIPTGDPNTWITPWGATYNTPGSVNNQTSADYDAWRQRTYGNMMGPQGKGPNTNPYSELTDALVRQPGSINTQTFQGYLNSLQQQQTGPYPPQQTAPRPPQNSGQPQYAPYNGAPGSPEMRHNALGPSLNGYQTEGDMYDSLFGRGAAEFMAQQEKARIEDITSRLGLKYTPRGGPGQMISQDLAPDPLGIGVDRRNYTMADGSPVNWNALTQQYGKEAFSASQMNRRGTNGFNAPSQYTPGSFLNGQPTQSPIIGSSGMMGGPTRQTYDPRITAQLDQQIFGYPAEGMPGGGPNLQQMATQFSSDPAQQQAYMRDMMGGGQQQDPYGWYPQPESAQQPQVDFRAATFGGGSLFPAPAGGSGGGNSNIPNIANPITNQHIPSAMASWGNATQRRSGFGGMSLFGNGMGSGNMGGQYGQPASQYRGAGSYGRPASFGQSQRPNF